MKRLSAALFHAFAFLYGDREFNRREKARSLRLCAVSLCLDTGGQLPLLDNRTFSIDPPF